MFSDTLFSFELFNTELFKTMQRSKCAQCSCNEHIISQRIMNSFVKCLFVDVQLYKEITDCENFGRVQRDEIFLICKYCCVILTVGYQSKRQEEDP